MKVRMLSPSYESSDGYVFEPEYTKDALEIGKAIHKADSYQDVITILKEKDIPFSIYRKEEIK